MASTITATAPPQPPPPPPPPAAAASSSFPSPAAAAGGVAATPGSTAAACSSCRAAAGVVAVVAACVGTNGAVASALSYSDADVAALVKARAAARRAGDYTSADSLRARLLGAGVVVLDGCGRVEASSWMRVRALAGAGARHHCCMVWSHRKLRFCPATRAVGEWFCPAHVKGGLRGRVPCPLDPRHNLKPAKVAAHLEVCQSKPGTTALAAADGLSSSTTSAANSSTNNNNTQNTTAAGLHIARGCNHGQACGGQHVDVPSGEDVAALCRDAAVLSALEAKVNAAMGAVGALAPLPIEHLHADKVAPAVGPACFAETPLPKVGVRRGKEVPQNLSIVNHLMQAAALRDADGSVSSLPSPSPRVAAVECCAGKGRLSLCLQNELPEADYILVDRATRRRCVDDTIRAAQRAARMQHVCTVKRVTMDMADLCLAGLPAVAQAHTTLAYGKHLCGAAADLSIRACQQLAAATPSVGTVGDGTDDSFGAGASAGATVTLAFALCCHHLCEWQHLVGRAVLEAHGIDAKDFALMKRLCTSYRKRPKGRCHTAAGKLALQRADMGIKCKRLINELRAHGMRQAAGHRWASVRVVEYVSESVSPENQLLVATTATTTPTTTPRLRQTKRQRTARPPASMSAPSLVSVGLTLMLVLLLMVSIITPPVAEAYVENPSDSPIPPAAPPDRPMPRQETGVDGIGVQVAVGMTVERGPDWRYGNQDGRDSKRDAAGRRKLRKGGGLGTIVEVREWITAYNDTDGTERGKAVTVPGSVRVQWHSGAGVNVYRYGAEGKYDVRVVDQKISAIDWESVMRQMPEDYALPSQKASLRNQVETAPADRAALVALYRATNGPLWIAKKGWDVGAVARRRPQADGNGNGAEDDSANSNSNNNDAAAPEVSDPCRDHWSGVTCDTTARPARVFALDLANNRLSGRLPIELGNLTSLRTLTLSNNALMGPLPPSLAKCVNLEFLSVEINQLSGPIPRAFGNLRELQWLSLYNNQFSDAIPREVMRLPLLRHVLLQQNQFSGPRPQFSAPLERYESHGNNWERTGL